MSTICSLGLYICYVPFSSSAICIDFCDIWHRIPARRAPALRAQVRNCRSHAYGRNGAEDVIGAEPLLFHLGRYVSKRRVVALGSVVRAVVRGKEAAGATETPNPFRWCSET
jgi:hypothetical protein